MGLRVFVCGRAPACTRGCVRESPRVLSLPRISSLSLSLRRCLSPSSAELGWALKPDGWLRCTKKNQLKFSPVDTFIKRKLVLLDLCYQVLSFILHVAAVLRF